MAHFLTASIPLAKNLEMHLFRKIKKSKKINKALRGKNFFIEASILLEIKTPAFCGSTLVYKMYASLNQRPCFFILLS